MSRDRAAASRSQDGLRKAIIVYLTLSAFAHFTWEGLQLPLYTIWNTGTIREKAFALAHCTAGDFLIATSCLVAALILAGSRDWPNEKFLRVAGVDVVAHPAEARLFMGVVTQFNTLDRQCTVWENLYFHCRYFGLSHAHWPERRRGPRGPGRANR